MQSFVEENVDYKAPAPKDLQAIIHQDEGDESLRRYKEQLLGNANAEKIEIGALHACVICFGNSSSQQNPTTRRTF